MDQDLEGSVGAHTDIEKLYVLYKMIQESSDSMNTNNIKMQAY